MTILGTEAVDLGLFALYIAAGFAIGWLVDLLVLGGLRGLARKREWTPWRITLKGLGHMPVWWFALAGAAFGLQDSGWTPRLSTLTGRVLVVLAGLTVTYAAMRIATGFVRGYAVSASGPLPSTSIFVNLTRIAIVLLGALIVLNALNISITPVLTALGVGGLAVALALQDTLGNLFAGLQIVASKQVRPGDYLLLETGQEGTVEDIAWRYTTLRTQANNLVVVPNAKLGQAIVTNYQLPEQPLSITVEFGVAYGSDLDRTEAIALDVAARVMAELQPDITDWEPLMRFRGFGDSQVQAAIIMRVLDYGDQYALKSEFIKRLHARFAEEGIEFPFPQRVVHQLSE
ncbi:MAG: mechanosensitive ion channel protein MscS [Actinobacteria bacterium HGW-Actinobacteria-1]|jgi:small-conductance mechanosensitive channel|nr:MAG: mechanosensitive ion channel protein MscS [Actinobacteria bacterium HGW-Actinobacteria-1]